jgi:acyl-coenzyme A thioesterase 9
VLYSSIKEEIPGFAGFEPTGEGNKNIPLVSVEVEAWIVDPSTASARLSNRFYSTFALPGNTPIRKVLPSNMEEARTMALRMAADKVQDEEY